MTSSAWENIEVGAEVTAYLTDVVDASETGETLISEVVAETGVVYLKTLVAGENVTLDVTDEEITISASASGGGLSSAPTEYKFTASSAQVDFVVDEYATSDTVIVFLDGIKLSYESADYAVTSASASTITLNSGSVGGAVLEIYVFASLPLN